MGELPGYVASLVAALSLAGDGMQAKPAGVAFNAVAWQQCLARKAFSSHFPHFPSLNSLVCGMARRHDSTHYSWAQADFLLFQRGLCGLRIVRQLAGGSQRAIGRRRASPYLSRLPSCYFSEGLSS